MKLSQTMQFITTDLSESVKYHWKLLQVALGMYIQVTRVQRVGTPQTSQVS